MFRKHIINDEILQDWIEEQSILWSDDLDLASSIVLKTVKTIAEDSEDLLLSEMWKSDGDDKQFLDQLFSKTLAMAEEHDAAIESAASNWDLDRIATMDLILLRMALAEARNFECVCFRASLGHIPDLRRSDSAQKSDSFFEA